MLGRTIKKNEEKNDDVIPYESCLAKTFFDASGKTSPGRSVFEHCMIVGTIAEKLLKRMPTKNTGKPLPAGTEVLVAIHDIGKVSPCFQAKLRKACGQTTTESILAQNPEMETQWGGHAGTGQVAAKAIGVAGHGPAIIGNHHGFAPPIIGIKANAEILGGARWQAQRNELTIALRQAFDAVEPTISDGEQARLLAGLTAVADWIGSGSSFEDPTSPWRDKIDDAIDKAGFIVPRCRQGLRFEDVFGFSPNPTQSALIENVRGPGIHVLEAPMGIGKTEAALFAAYSMMSKGISNGIYFALPTQLTSNKIHERVTPFLRAILEEDRKHRPLLLHGQAWMMEIEMGEEAQPGGDWFNHAKRGLLAPFAVGTIDQALMAAMNVRHGPVRAFGLAGKTVILDEVHTYDAYTGTLLDALVELLRKLNSTVIILSATLNRDRRGKILDATTASDAYPLITAKRNEKETEEIPVVITEEKTVVINATTSDYEAMDLAIERAGNGEQVLWVENTVAEAQDAFMTMAARARPLGIECGLLHSRFTAEDRRKAETHWVDLFGKNGADRRSETGRILVGTQVLEQSLDIDADFLVTRFAPTDMLLQRIGRLWRHDGTKRPTSALRQALLLSPETEAAKNDPSKEFGPSAFVYSAYALCRSLEVWKDLRKITLPSEIRSLIDRSYAPRDETGTMATWLSELDDGRGRRKGRKALRRMATLTLAEEGSTNPESFAQTRYAEQETCDVLLLKSIDFFPETKTCEMRLSNGERIRIPQERHRLDQRSWRNVAAKLAGQTISVPVKNAPNATAIETLETLGLHHCFHLGKNDDAGLRPAIIDENGDIKNLLRHSSDETARQNYDSELGYRNLKDPK